jgi:hypothetical protein
MNSREKRKGDPAPANLDALTAAYQSKDPIAIAREKAIYNAQLIEAGRPPLYNPPEPLWKD